LDSSYFFRNIPSVSLFDLIITNQVFTVLSVYLSLKEPICKLLVEFCFETRHFTQEFFIVKHFLIGRIPIYRL